MAVEFILSFDTEDYETPAADDAEKAWAEMQASVRHPALPSVLELGENGPQAYLVLEYVDGVPLRQRIAEGRINGAELHRELVAGGVRLSYPAVRRYLTRRLGWAGKTRPRVNAARPKP